MTKGSQTTDGQTPDSQTQDSPGGGSQLVDVIKLTRGAGSAAVAQTPELATVSDRVIVEEPLEMVLDGELLAITMRTPGADRELALGFAYSEGLIASLADLDSVEVLAGENTGLESSGAASSPVVRASRVELIHSAQGRRRVEIMARDRRLFPASSACGLCGRRSLEDLWQRIPAIVRPEIEDPALRDRLDDWLAAMRERQHLFAQTGGCHAAALFDLAADADVAPLVVFEDVGRHNAVDKVVGWALDRDRLPLAGHGLLTSARAGFEIVQKSATAGLPLVIALGAASSLAIEMASFAGLRLFSFAGGELMNRHL